MFKAVALPSGGKLVIDHTEALVSIDFIDLDPRAVHPHGLT